MVISVGYRIKSHVATRFRIWATERLKEYLNQEELEILNRIVSMYLDFAELQAWNITPMYMKDWISHLWRKSIL